MKGMGMGGGTSTDEETSSTGRSRRGGAEGILLRWPFQERRQKMDEIDTLELQLKEAMDSEAIVVASEEIQKGLQVSIDFNRFQVLSLNILNEFLVD